MLRLTFLLGALAFPIVSPVLAGPIVDCKTFLVGTWHGEHFVKDVSSVTLTITYGADGKFSAERTESKGTTYASDDMPVGTWEAKATESPRMCQIARTNGYSGEVESEWIDVVGPDTYSTGHGDAVLEMQRQKP